MPGRALLSRRARAAPRSAALMRSSAISKLGATPASSGKRRSSDWQKAWIVWILSPSGTSSTAAKRRRARSSVACGRFCPGQHLERSGERVVVGHSPAREIARDPERHLGGGRAGEGEAEDALGRRAPQQQPQHAVRQHLGLARAGRGTDPDRGRRVRRPVLSRRHPGCVRGPSWVSARHRPLLVPGEVGVVVPGRGPAPAGAPGDRVSRNRRSERPAPAGRQPPRARAYPHRRRSR